MDVLDAVRDKNNVRLEEFLQSGADPNSMTVTGQNLLTYAVLMRNTEAVNLLINKGADVNTPNKQAGIGYLSDQFGSYISRYSNC